MITQFMTDQNVFGSEFTGVSWNAWKALLSGFYGETCTDIEMFFALTQRPPAAPYSELWLGNWTSWWQIECSGFDSRL